MSIEVVQRIKLREFVDAVMDCIEIDYEHPVVTELGVAFTIDRDLSQRNMAVQGLIEDTDI